jgi:phenylpropionate dioxygenase-like ring-hydroxylating dioxygenase large terminal subunit
MKLSLFLLPFWYPFALKEKVSTQPTKINFFSNPYTIYKNENSTYVAHTDICPHQGASLSRGHVDKAGFLNCPYHGFQFRDGHFCNIPNSNCATKGSFRKKMQMETLSTYGLHKDLIFVRNDTLSDTIPPIYFPPEEKNSSFRVVHGAAIIPTNYLSVCENLLDMLHISYVHTFGSRQNPLPYNLSFDKISDYHGRSTFFYKPNQNSISGKIGKKVSVHVENEYILPTNTVTRVIAGDVVKTVFTRSIPISENKTILYWQLHRNFLMHPFFDFLIRFLMERTLKEDVLILKNVYPDYREGILKTKYDKTIFEFRNSINYYNKLK